MGSSPALSQRPSIDTRARHRQLYEWVRHELALSQDGARLMRRRADSRRPWKVLEAHKRGRPDAASPGTTRYVMVGGIQASAHLIAHVLRVGPDGPLIQPGRWLPADGDWLHVHPDNWRLAEPSETRGAAGRAAALRARKAAVASGLAGHSGRPGNLLYPSRAVEDARYWWAQAVAAWGDSSPELSMPWDGADETAPRHWALSHHLAQRARQRLAGLPLSCEPRAALAFGTRIDEARLACLAERAEIIADADRWARVVAWATGARLRGELHDTPERAARWHAAKHTTMPVGEGEPTAPATGDADSDDADLY